MIGEIPLMFIIIVAGSLVISYFATKFMWKTAKMIIFSFVWGVISYFIAKYIIYLIR